MDWNILLLALAGVTLFLFGIEGFSREIQNVANDKFKKILRKATDNRFKGTLFGAIVTSIIQSSTATTVITVGLVNAGIITFVQSLGIIFGANLGTTITAQLISLKLTYFAPIFIILGFLISLAPKSNLRLIGKPLFYFGLVFFSLNFISSLLAPYNSDPEITHLLLSSSNIFLGILIGFILTNIFQSSSVMTGLVIVFAQNNLLTLPQGFFIILGSNLGTTTTALLASLRMNSEAKKTALSHFLFNLIGIIIIIPFVNIFLKFVNLTSSTISQSIANAHTIFNLTLVILFLVFFSQFKKLVELVYNLISSQK